MQIEVTRRPAVEPPTFDVVVHEHGEETRHQVTLAAADHARLAPGQPPERCIEAAFRFLLDREPAQAILGRFDLLLISKYFPEFERELARYLAD
jgi:hypothetical protein